MNQVNSLNLRRESTEKLARRNDAYRDARCSVSWIVHTGALSGGAALEETVRDLQRIAGVAANKEWMPDGTTRIKYGVPQFLQVPSLPKDFDFATRLATAPSPPDCPEPSASPSCGPSTPATAGRSPCPTAWTPRVCSRWRRS